MKKRLYFNEYNVRMGGFSYLPLVSGLLRAYAETFPEIRENYEFMPFIYAMDTPSKILAQYTETPDIACFSSVMWNEQLNYHIAAEVKRRWPNCLIVFGGPNVPMPPQHDINEWMFAHPFVDVAVRAEGEEPFVEILKRYITSYDFEDIPGVAFREEAGIMFCDKNREFKRDMDEYPSPYLEGMYDYLLEWGRKEGHQFQAIIETNRGCLAEGTLIQTQDGIKTIEEVSSNDLVLGWDEQLSKSVWNIVEQSVCTGTKPTLSLKIGNRNVRATTDHPIFSDNGWKRADEIQIGDKILCDLWNSDFKHQKPNLLSRLRGKVKIAKSSIGLLEKAEKTRYFKLSNLFDQLKVTIYLCWRLFFLDWPMSIRQTSQPGLHQRREEKSDTCPWAVVAQRTEKKRRRIIGLFKKWVVLFHHLGRRNVGLNSCKENTRFSWVSVDAISVCGDSKVYDLVNAFPNPNFFANGVLVHNCPFPCTFCYWGKGGLSRKFRYKNMDKVHAEIDWMGKNNIRYVFNADSNFGMNDRDQEIADFIVETKHKYGFPEKFRTCFGKNTDEKIFKIGALFHSNQLEKGITLARQSNDLETLKNIRRNNIKMSTYVNLQKQFNDLDIPVYGELILGLPGETKETWRKGVDELLEAGTKNQLFIYLCQIFANTEMAEKPYMEKYGIKTKRIKLAEIHGQERPPEFVQEYEDIIIETNSMSHADWVESLRFSYVLMLFHSLKMAYYVMIYLMDKYGIKMSEFISFVAERKFDVEKAPMMAKELDFYDNLIKRMIDSGEHRGTILPEYGDLYWDVEEASFLHLTQNSNDFYLEMLYMVFTLLDSRKIDWSEDGHQIVQAVVYQKSRIPQQPNEHQDYNTKVVLDWDFPQYFESRFGSSPVSLVSSRVEMILVPEDFKNDLKEFAKKSILWGRKSGTMLVKYTWRKIEQLSQQQVF